MTALPTRNLLAEESSPYLLQHKDNPVHWRPWGPEALAEAKALNKPILLSVGYAACHWCHVMAHESFEDISTATVMNALFVNIKVDREERPDIDQIYMNALHVLGEPGGWPLTMFLTPDGEPFWGGTYFPPRALYGRPGFVQVLRTMAGLYEKEPGKIEQNRAAIVARLKQPPREASRSLTPDILGEAAEMLVGLVDRDHGGPRGAPKFPQVSFLELLWRAFLRTGDTRHRDAVVLTLARMCRGGIYDHIGGGFARYAVDEEWLVPHFEKMLYDNGQILEILAHVHAETGAPVLRERAEATIAWLVREMRLEGGAFASSLDADSDGLEGAYYVWQLGEIEEILGPGDAARFAAIYGIGEEGNWEGKNIAHRLEGPIWLGDEEEGALAPLRAKLLAARENRVPPARDDKVLADWNGLAVKGLAAAGIAFARPDWTELAAAAYRHIKEAMWAGGRLAHAMRDGRISAAGLAGDYAAMIGAALALAEATGRQSYIEDARAFFAALDAHHWSEEAGGYHLTADDANDLILRPFSAQDEAIPGANGALVGHLTKLNLLTGDPLPLARADRIVATFTGETLTNAFSHAGLLNGFDTRVNAVQIVIAGPAGEERDALRAAALSASLPARVLQEVEEGAALPPGHPATGKGAVAGRPAAYICIGPVCSVPLTEPAMLVDALRAGRSPHGEAKG